jgi:hypothetical protein
VHLARRRAADEERHREALALHLAGDERHLLERRRDEPRQADEVDALELRALEDRRRGHHHAHVDDLEAVTLEHHADDVLADVVHVALDRGEQHAAGAARAGSSGPAGGAVELLLLDVGDEVRDRALHHARALHHLRQEHLPAPNRSPTTFIPAMSGPSITSIGRANCLPRLLGVLDHELVDAVHERVAQPLGHRERPPAASSTGPATFCPR